VSRIYGGIDKELLKQIEDALAHPDLQTACADQSALPALRDLIVNGWIDDQAGWHGRTAARKLKKSKWLERGVQLLFGITLIAALMHATGIGHETGEHGAEGQSRLGQIIVLLTIALPACASSLHGIKDLLDYERLAHRYEHMQGLLKHAAAEARNATTMDELRSAVIAAEEIMVIENGEWLVSLGFRQLPPAPT
jgi:hypothetical protein